MFGFHGWILVIGPCLLLGLSVLVLFSRRAQLLSYARSHRELVEARERGSDKARLQHPEIDLTNCIGCGACVRACPEDGVLAILHGQAIVVHGARCVGHGLCAGVCPTGAISLTLGDLSNRRDLPALNENLEAVKVPGLFLAGEISGFALVRTAVAQGTSVVDTVAKRLAAAPSRTSNDVLDLLIVGAGPGGMAASLRAKELQLNFLTIEQEARLGGTVASYPRKKLVMTQPMDLPLYGRLSKLMYLKEELVDIWESASSQNNLPIRLGAKLEKVSRHPDGLFAVTLADGSTLNARNVCLSLGRRGSPRRLGVPGEDMAKVSYSLLDAESYKNRKILVVGGGDSAAEAALGLADQPGNEVTISYRKEAFSRLKARNDARMKKAIHEKKLRAVFNSDVVSIGENEVIIRVGSEKKYRLPNDEVFIFAGGEPPFALLEQAGVSFDPRDRPAPTNAVDRNTGLLAALTLTFLCSLALIAWGYIYRGYYHIEPMDRGTSSLHDWLRPSGQIGLWAGIGGTFLFVWNLAYLLRRNPTLGRPIPGTLRTWMSWHVFTGLLGLLAILLHSGFNLRSTPGGHALILLGVVIITGTIGRYFYAMFPRAANGTEASLSELRSQLAVISAEWDRDGRGFGLRVREKVEELIHDSRWRPGFLSRIHVLISGQLKLRRLLKFLHRLGRAEGIPEVELRHILALARRAYRTTVVVTHYEEVAAVLSSWRYFHRWLGLAMVLLTIAHIVTAVKYADLDLHIGQWVILGGGQ